MTGTARRKKNKPAPAQIVLMLKDRQFIESRSSEELQERRDRLEETHDRLYGRAAYVQGDGASDPVGGCVGGVCCSHAWADDCWESKTLYPPRAKATPMVVCPKCRAHVPALTIEGDQCADCQRPYEHEKWGPSVSGMAITAIGDLKLRLVETELEPEDDSSLRREIMLAQTGEFVPR